MKQDTDWLDELSGRLRDAHTPPPEGGWERLERELPAVPKGFRFVLHGRRAAAVAAVVLVLVAAGDAFRRARKVTEEHVRVVAAAAAVDSVRPDPAIHPASGEAELVHLASGTPQIRKKRSARVFDAVPALRPASAAAETGSGAAELPESEPEKNAAIPEDRTAATLSDDAERFAEEVPARNKAAASGREYALSDPKRSVRERPRNMRIARGKTAVGLFAGGGMSASEHVSGGLPMSMAGLHSPGQGVHLLKYDYRNISYDHKLPLRFGISVGREFPCGLTLESGVVYTLLRSEAAIQFGDRKMRQRLHMLGIPLRLNWRFYERGDLSIYIGAGAMAEKCIGARFDGVSVREEAVQGSLFGAAGIAYRLGGPASLYFEPEVSWYFTRTRLRTVRTDQPVSLSLQLGLRFSF